MEYCDNCAKELNVQTRRVVESLNVDIASANKGESATLCPKCCLDDALAGIDMERLQHQLDQSINCPMEE